MEKTTEKTTAYYLGLDMGTSSVGWAVTDAAYKLLRAKGKDLWGVRLFEEASTSEERRTNRVSRRRRQREVARIGTLKELFADEISKVDASFYERMKDSKYHLEDKTTQSRYAIFADKNYSDVQYYEEYPTIFHLRKELLESTAEHDIRLVFLALLNMFKHRGHFLNKNLSADDQGELEQVYEELIMSAQEVLGIELPTCEKMREFKELLSKRDISRTKKAEEVAVLLGINKSKEKNKYEVVKAITGLSIKVYTLVGANNLDEEHKNLTLCFTDAGYEDKLLESQGKLSEPIIELLGLMKQIHDYGVLSSVMKGSQYLSQARVKSYEKHKQDLKVLKEVIDEFKPDSYDDMFRKEKTGSYSAYVGSVNSDVKARRSVTKTKVDELYKEIEKLLKDMPQDDGRVVYIRKEISTEGFLPKQLTSANGVIPHQVHLKELQQILINAEGYLGFLKSTDETGLTVSEKIEKLYTFQIPYYVGPLSEQHKNKGGNAWVVRKEGGKIYPWNFEEKIDTKKSAEEFIIKMVRHCTYLQEETALPKSSLLYEKYMVLNELNNLKIRGEKPSVELKQAIYFDLFQKGKKVKQKQLLRYLCGKGIVEENEVDAISGIDVDFQNTLSSWSKFYALFGSDLNKDYIQAMVEQIIFWGTIYGDDKKFLRERITEVYGESITKEQLKRIVGYKFKDWGRLSQEFMETSGCNKYDGESISLIQMMWTTNNNLMELLSEQYTYKEQILDKCRKIEKSLSEMQYDDLENMYLSTPVKRMVWQTLLILKELEEVLGSQPKKIFVEMTRSHDVNGQRTKSRRSKFLELYKGCKEDAREWKKEIENKDEADFRRKKLYLYYTQKGRCMYTGEPISLSDLDTDNLYDIDHIYPRHFVKDDSIENNLVLVKKQVNAHKSDNYPIEESIYKKQHYFWKTLLTSDLKDGFITREKYNRLINRNSLTEEQLAGFINRQIVETGQGTKTITQILGQVYQESEVVFVKAGNVSVFRKDQKLLKCRSINDFHHAQDAYLNIVVGNVYNVKFTKNPMNFIKEFRKNPGQNSYHLSKMFNYSVRRGEEVAWIVGENGVNTKDIVHKMVKKNSPLITKMTVSGHGGLADQTLYSAKKAKDVGYIPLKGHDTRLADVKKYGGFSSTTTAFFTLIEHEKKGKSVRSIETIPLYICGCEDMNMTIVKYCVEQLKLVNPVVRLERIPIQSLVKRNGYYMRITGKSGAQLIMNNAMALCIAYKWVRYIKGIENTLLKEQVDNQLTKMENLELYDEELVKKYKEKIYCNRPNPMGVKLEEKKGAFEQLSIFEQCKIISEILKLSMFTNIGADLNLIGGAKQAGTTFISKNICGVDEFKLVYQSPTGLYEREIDLLTI